MPGTNLRSPPPAKEQWDDLCREVKSQLLEEMGDESWYLIIVSQQLFWQSLLASCLPLAFPEKGEIRTPFQ